MKGWLWRRRYYRFFVFTERGDQGYFYSREEMDEAVSQWRREGRVRFYVFEQVKKKGGST